MGVVELLTILAGSGVFSGLLTYFLRRRNANRTVKVAEFDVVTREWRELYAELRGRMEGLEKSLIVERDEHRTTRRLLALAVTHIHDVVTWAAGDRKRPIPEPPMSLMEHIY